MKYSQYHEARQLLETDLAKSYGYDVNEWDSLPPEEKAEQLNEIVGFGALTLFGVPLAKAGIAAGAGLVGLGIAFRKKIAAKGRLRRGLKTLKKEAEKFKKQAIQGLEKAIAPQVEAKKKIKADAGVDTWKQLPADKKKELAEIEVKIARVLSDYVNRVAKIKTEEIYTLIDSKKKLTDSTKLALKFSWETLAAETKVGLLAELMKDRVIESPRVIEMMDDSFATMEKEIKKKQAETVKGYNSAVKKEKESDGDNPEEDSDEDKPVNTDVHVGDKYILKSKHFGTDMKSGDALEKEVEITEKGKEGDLKYSWKAKNDKIITTTTKKDLKPFIVKQTSFGEGKTAGEGEITDEKI